MQAKKDSRGNEVRTRDALISPANVSPTLFDNSSVASARIWGVREIRSGIAERDRVEPHLCQGYDTEECDCGGIEHPCTTRDQVELRAHRGR